jgi:2-isopropylmalate synthase
MHPRHPYAGELVFTAFSGSHQDAIKKCLEAPDDGFWDVAYLPIDPKDIGRSYQDVVRINSQSGKGGVAYVLQNNYGVEMPRWLQICFSGEVQQLAEAQESELSVAEIWQLFRDIYMAHEQPFALQQYSLVKKEEAGDVVTATLMEQGGAVDISGEAFGALSAFIVALETQTGRKLRVLNYNEHALSVGTRAEAIAYVELDVDDIPYVGVATSKDTVSSMFKATLSALNAAIEVAQSKEILIAEVA